MNNPILARESVHIRYKGTEAWLPASIVDVWRPEDVIEGREDAMAGALLTRDLMRAAYISLSGRGFHVQTITRLVLGRVVFGVVRCNGVLLDCTGRELEVIRVNTHDS